MGITTSTDFEEEDNSDGNCPIVQRIPSSELCMLRYYVILLFFLINHIYIDINEYKQFA